MSRCSMLLVAALSVVLVPALMAQDHGGGHGTKPTGKIKSVDATAKTVTVTVGKDADAKDVVYTVTDTTKITVDKNDAAKLDDLKAGMVAWVTADDKNVASEIKARTPRAPKSDK